MKSAPTHAAEAAVRIDCGEARSRALTTARRLDATARRAVVDRARHLAALSRAPAHHLERERIALHQKAREMRAAAGRQIALRSERTDRHRLVIERKAEAARREPQQMLERGYALVEDREGEMVTSAEAARAARELSVRFRDDRVNVRTHDR